MLRRLNYGVGRRESLVSAHWRTEWTGGCAYQSRGWRHTEDTAPSSHHHHHWGNTDVSFSVCTSNLPSPGRGWGHCSVFRRLCCILHQCVCVCVPKKALLILTSSQSCETLQAQPWTALWSIGQTCCFKTTSDMREQNAVSGSHNLPFTTGTSLLWDSTGVLATPSISLCSNMVYFKSHQVDFCTVSLRHCAGTVNQILFQMYLNFARS